MSVTYYLINTETLGNNQVRTLRAYDIGIVGVVVNIYVDLTIYTPHKPTAIARISDDEVYVPGVLRANIPSNPFTTINVEDLGLGQKRLVRQLVLDTSYGSLISVVRTTDFMEGKVSKTLVQSEIIYWRP